MVLLPDDQASLFKLPQWFWPEDDSGALNVSVILWRLSEGSQICFISLCQDLWSPSCQYDPRTKGSAPYGSLLEMKSLRFYPGLDGDLFHVQKVLG